MGKAPHLTPTKRAQIVAYHDSGKTVRKISTIVGKSKTTVNNCIKNFKIFHSFKDRAESGRPRKTSKREDCLLFRVVRPNPFLSFSQARTKLQEMTSVVISCNLVRTRLRKKDLRSYREARKPHLTNAMKRKRVQFSRQHRKWTPEDWCKVLWSDESSYPSVPDWTHNCSQASKAVF